MDRLANVLGDVVRWLARKLVLLYYSRIYVSNRELLPEQGPVLFVANHANSLLDAVMVGRTARRPVHFLAKAPLFTIPVFGPALHALGMVPAYRASDDPSKLSKNLDSI
ncbi:MAG TPA: 1-acyl-sn-glycerol-3-phosphate acyltransferase, partial [Verrucomicrobiae bacterium]|nr:1-acyl-sn-glycerol-3-phosphate acyltransferase [Verrucomicrobiae bacterium]